MAAIPKGKGEPGYNSRQQFYWEKKLNNQLKLCYQLKLLLASSKGEDPPALNGFKCKALYGLSPFGFIQ